MFTFFPFTYSYSRKRKRKKKDIFKGKKTINKREEDLEDENNSSYASCTEQDLAELYKELKILRENKKNLHLM